MTSTYTEETLVQQTTAEYLESELGWESIYAYNNEDFGPDSLLGRMSDREVVLTRPLRAKLAALNPGLPSTAYDDAVRQIIATTATQSFIATNREKYGLIRDGVQVTFRNQKGERVRQRLKLFDFAEPTNNDFLCVRELWVRGDLYRRRADIVGFVNGLPLLFMELKNINKDIRAAYENNFKDYKDTVGHLFHFNAFVVLANGVDAKLGSVTSRFEHFHDWKRLVEDQPGVVDMETLLKGTCEKKNFIDLMENFILFDDSAGETKKILARNHQFLGVNRAIAAVEKREDRDRKLGVFWHTQGAGKSYSMVMFTRKVHRKLGGNFTFLVLTDRDDLDTQIYKTFAGCGVVDNDREPCRAANGKHLSQLMTARRAYIFSLIQKFNQEIEEHPFRVAIVCAMWLTGFDVPSLATLYLDKPLKAHTLMQAIARANRVNEGKNNGMIVDYCGILKNLRKALATFAGTGDDGRSGGGQEMDPTRPKEELLADLAEAIAFVRGFLAERNASLDDIIIKSGFERNAAILAAKEAANENDETRKRFEVICRVVFAKFKACITVEGVNTHRKDYAAINIVYKSLQQDREQADISDIIRQLHQVVDEAITVQPDQVAEEQAPYDISRIDFEWLRNEFERSPARRTTVQNLRTAIEQRLLRLMQQNPLRTDFQRHYEEIVADYNREKDRVTIERTFEELMRFVDEMSAEECRATREGLNEESLAVFDLLRKEDLTPKEIKLIKAIAVDLLAALKAEKLRIDHWQEKEATRDAVRLAIHDFLWSDDTGLPVDHYTEDDVKVCAENVYHHVMRVYPTLPSPFYQAQAGA